MRHGIGMRGLSIDALTYDTIGRIVEAWSRPDGEKMTKAKVVEIVFKFLPGKMGWDDIDEIVRQGLLSPDPGRPSKCVRCRGRGSVWNNDMTQVIPCPRCPTGKRVAAQLRPAVDPLAPIVDPEDSPD